MIRFYVEQDPSYPIPVTYLPLMKRVIRACVDEAYPSHRFEVELTLCGDEEIHGVNKEFRGIDRPTDVLSFPMMEFSMPEVYVSLGNIILSVELCFLCAHSALHLLGYDHETEDEREEMEAKQREILDALGIKR